MALLNTGIVVKTTLQVNILFVTGSLTLHPLVNVFDTLGHFFFISETSGSKIIR